MSSQVPVGRVTGWVDVWTMCFSSGDGCSSQALIEGRVRGEAEDMSVIDECGSQGARGVR